MSYNPISNGLVSWRDLVKSTNENWQECIKPYSKRWKRNCVRKTQQNKTKKAIQRIWALRCGMRRPTTYLWESDDSAPNRFVPLVRIVRFDSRRSSATRAPISRVNRICKGCRRATWAESPVLSVKWSVIWRFFLCWEIYYYFYVVVLQCFFVTVHCPASCVGGCCHLLGGYSDELQFRGMHAIMSPCSPSAGRITVKYPTCNVSNTTEAHCYRWLRYI